MTSLEQVAEAALKGEGLALRSLAQDWLRENTQITDSQIPRSNDPDVLAVSAALVEMFAERAGQPFPSWTTQIGALARPRFLLQAAATMKHLRRLCEMESPMPLRRRNLFAPPDFLRFV